MTVAKIVFSLDGTVRGIHSDISQEIAQAIGTIHIKRASHVEPTLDGRWTADMTPSGGPVLGPFQTRSEALEREVEWLEANDLGMGEWQWN